MDDPGLEIISLKDVVGSLTRRPGIVYGPNAVTTSESLSALYRAASESVFNQNESLVGLPCDNHRAFLDALKSGHHELADGYEKFIREGLRQLAPSMDLPYLAKAGWSVCISLTQDLLFESELRNHLDSIPSSRTVTLLDHPAVSPPARTIPVYKLLGNLDNSESGHSLAIAESELMLRQQMWPLLLKTSSDYLRESPLIFIGTESVVDLARSVVSTLLSISQPNVSKIIFLKDDPTLNDPTVRALCAQTKLEVIDASLRELCVAIGELKPQQLPLTLALNDDAKSSGLVKIYDKYQSVVSFVPCEKPKNYEIEKHKQTLVDGLFRPAVTDWLPYLCELDLTRTIVGDINQTIVDCLSSPCGDSSKYVLVRGEAGVGKTSVLKRVAVDLSQQNIQVIWCRRAMAGNWIRAYKELCFDLADHVNRNEDKKLQFVIVCDDPWGCE